MAKMVHNIVPVMINKHDLNNPGDNVLSLLTTFYAKKTILHLLTFVHENIHPFVTYK